MSKRLAPLVLALGCAQSAGVLALGLGELTLQSNLNEPLSARVDLLDTEGLSDDQVRIRLATEEDFDRLGLDRAYFLTSIQFEVRIEEGKGYIQLTSREPVLEPYLDFIIEARWPDGRLLREYTVLIDPPAFSAATPVASARQEVAVAEVEPAKKPAPRESGTVESGTRVTVDGATESAVEERSYTRGATTQAAPGSQYLIQRNDTLWSIASRAQPQGVSVHQTMLEIQRMNPDAFIDGNINQIKAGYIIYLPQTDDVGSDSYAEAVAQVREQNRAWRDNRGSGPSLRISSEPEPEREPASVEPVPAAPAAPARPEAVAASAEPGSAAINERLAALEGQLQTLERIVSLKDDQIAALQAALAESQAAAADRDAPAESLQAAPMQTATDAAGMDVEPTAAGTPTAEAEAAVATGQEAEIAPTEPVTVSEAEQVEQAAQAEPAAQAAQAEQQASAEAEAEAEEAAAGDGGLLQYLTYGLGLLTAIGAAVFFLFYRRRNREDEDADELDAFADVTLEDSDLVVDEVDPVAEPPVAVTEAEPLDEPEPPVEPAPEPAPVMSPAAPSKAAPETDLRGYGGKKHDQYASDMETGDALAEADIYIAYGRYPQAVDLLQKAIESDPGNIAFRLKLLELCADMNNREEAQQQYADLRELGDGEALARAREIVEGAPEGEAWLASLPPASPAVSGAVKAEEPAAGGEILELDLPEELELPELDDGQAPVDLTADTGEELEQDFPELAIEQPQAIDDDLDLSKDFLESQAADQPSAEEEMVFAAEGDEASTKLDLARAYLDMGDEEGARQILEEVAAEAEGDPRDEAQELLAKLG